MTWYTFPLVASALAGSGVVRIDPLPLLAGCRTRRLNKALSVMSLSLSFFSVSVVLLHCVILGYLCVLSLGCSC